MLITCACGKTFEKTGRGRPPTRCENCRKDKRPVISMKNWTSDLDKESDSIHKDLISFTNKAIESQEVPNKLVKDTVSYDTFLVPKDGNNSNLNANNFEIKRKLQCEFGHTWMAPVKRGRTPRFCPEHINKASKISERTTTTKHQGELLRKILEAPAASSCACGINPETTPAELRAIGDASCTHPHHICSTLDACRRAMGM